MKFIIVDDSEYYRKHLTAHVNAINGYEVIATAETGYELLQLVKTHTPKVILADVHLPDMNVMDAAREILLKQPQIHFLCITQSNVTEWIYEMQQIGIKGYLYKGLKAASIEKAMAAILVGHFYADEEVVNNLVKDVRRSVSSSELKELSELDDLNKSEQPLSDKVKKYGTEKTEFTERELYILSATASGVKVEVIAKYLGLSARSISTFKETMRMKLDVKSNPELIRAAVKLGII